jgi:NAD(P)-dependent dehydrogenase (short-subunit alcohol dehydrogenase family)
VPRRSKPVISPCHKASYHNQEGFWPVGWPSSSLACRNPTRAKEAIEKIKALVPGSDPQFLKLDITSLNSAHSAAHEFLKLENRLDILVNNAGIVWVHFLPCLMMNMTSYWTLKLKINIYQSIWSALNVFLSVGDLGFDAIWAEWRWYRTPSM